MVEIESRIEAVRAEPDYGGREFTSDERAQGAHRKFVGGLWEEHGRHQLEFLVGQGLRPEDRFLDVGCGALRAGRFLSDHLQPSHYFGIDVNRSAMVAGYEDELTADQRQRVPLANLRHTDRFDADFGVTFDMAIAQSVFTHVQLNAARLCLCRVAKVMRPGGRFFVTFFEAPADTEIDTMLTRPRRFSDRNPYWYYRSDMRWVARNLPWRFRYLGDWGHPTGQRMVEYTRLSPEEFAALQARLATAPGPATLHWLGSGLRRAVRRS